MNNNQNNFLKHEYISRINLVQDYIEENIAEHFSVDSLARVANFSPYHFHRIFSTFTGEPLFQYIQRVRLEKAAFLLLADRHKYIAEIAGMCGFSTQAVFTRAFKKQFGTSPGRYREEKIDLCSKESKTESKPGQDLDEIALYNHIVNSEQKFHEKPDVIQPDNICVQNISPLYVVYIRHTGPYKQDEQLFISLFGKLYKWAYARELCNKSDTRWLTIYHSDPEITQKENLRISICMTVPDNTKGEGEVNTMLIPGGKYAIGHFSLQPDQYQLAWNYMFGSWLPESGYQPDDRYSMELYPSLGQQNASDSHAVDIYIPIKPI